MKKRKKALSLHKETLLYLSGLTGRATTPTQTCASCNQSCDCSTRNGPGCPDSQIF